MEKTDKLIDIHNLLIQNARTHFLIFRKVNQIISKSGQINFQSGVLQTLNQKSFVAKVVETIKI